MNSSSVKALVIDAGVGFRLLVPFPAQESLRGRLEVALADGFHLCAPTLWRYELTTIFSKAVHFKQVSAIDARTALQLSLELVIELVQPDPILAMTAYDWTLKLGRAAAYDSFYLALAQRYACELWTVDRRLFNAAGESWICYLGEPE